MAPPAARLSLHDVDQDEAFLPRRIMGSWTRSGMIVDVR
jgi:hypothetical protein